MASLFQLAAAGGPGLAPGRGCGGCNPPLYIMKIRSVIFQNRVLVSMMIVFFLFYMVHQTKPSIFYDGSGNHKQFGLGSRQRTIIPLWFAGILAAIFTYMGVVTVFRP